MGTKKHLTEYIESAQRQKSKLLDIPGGNLVLLQDHLEGCNKIQDKYKEPEFVMVHRHTIQISMTLNLSMVRAWCILSTDASYRILREPKKIKDLKILMLLIKGCKSLLQS